MVREEEPFLRRTLNQGALAPFGFEPEGDGWRYAEAFLNGAFTANMRIDASGAVYGEVIDNDLGEEYLPIRTEREVGAYVGAVREAYGAILARIADACFVPEQFLFPQTNRIAAKIAERYGETPDRPFAKIPTYAVFRVPETRKWYGLVMDITEAQLMGGSADADSRKVEVLNLKIPKERAEEIHALPGVYPGYHMKRADWISVLLDGTMPDDALLELIAGSRQFAAKGSKPRAGKTEWIVPANPKYYNVDAAFAQEDVILWKQSSAIRPGDIVYLYVAAPYSAVRYRCEAVPVDIPYPFQNKNVRMKTVMRIRRLATYPPEAVPFAKLCELGIRAVRGPRVVTEAFSAFMKTLPEHDCIPSTHS